MKGESRSQWQAAERRDLGVEGRYSGRMATFATSIDSTGRLTIPAKLRRQMNLTTGTKISIQREGAVLILYPITRDFIDSLMGCTQGAGAERRRVHR